MRWEGFGDPPTLVPPHPLGPLSSPGTCGWLGPIQVPGPCSCQLDAALAGCLSGMWLASARSSGCQDSFTPQNNAAIKAATTKDPLLPSERWDGQREGQTPLHHRQWPAAPAPLSGGTEGRGHFGGHGERGSGTARPPHAAEDWQQRTRPRLRGQRGRRRTRCPQRRRLPRPAPAAAPPPTGAPGHGTTAPHRPQRPHNPPVGPVASPPSKTLPVSRPFALGRAGQASRRRCRGRWEAHAEGPGQRQRFI